MPELVRVTYCSAPCLALIHLPSLYQAVPKIRRVGEVRNCLKQIAAYRRAPLGQGKFYCRDYNEAVKVRIGYRDIFTRYLSYLNLLLERHPAYPAFHLFYHNIMNLMEKLRPIDEQVTEIRY
jgi:hypothetical protein